MPRCQINASGAGQWKHYVPHVVPVRQLQYRLLQSQGPRGPPPPLWHRTPIWLSLKAYMVSGLYIKISCPPNVLATTTPTEDIPGATLPIHHKPLSRGVQPSPGWWHLKPTKTFHQPLQYTKWPNFGVHHGIHRGGGAS